MELALSLGDSTPKGFSFLDLDKPEKKSKDLGFCMALGKTTDEGESSRKEEEEIISSSLRCNNIDDEDIDEKRSGSSSDPPVQLDLLPSSPVPRNQASSSQLRFLLLSAENLAAEPGSTRTEPVKGLELYRRAPSRVEEAEEGGAAAALSSSSPNSTAVSSFQMDFNSFYNKNGKLLLGKRSTFEAASIANESDQIDNRGASSSRASDEEEINGGGASRKKLRLTKEQSAFLEECFKEHTTLNPKEKLALANQLNLRPRQVEVWFQNRRARTKLKQTEVDCEYLKRCCDALTEENRRLQKELQELRALKISKPFYMQLPATTLTMCPSCERVVSTTTSSMAAAATTKASPAAAANTADTGLSLVKPNLLLTFSPAEIQASKAAS